MPTSPPPFDKIDTTPPCLFRIDRDGHWFYRGSIIARPAMVKLFASILRREGDDYFLVTPVERERVLVDDAPFTAIALAVEGKADQQILRFTTNIGQEVTAGTAHPIVMKPGEIHGIKPYINLGKGMMALITRSVYLDLAELAVEEIWHGKARYGIWSQGAFFPLD
ncbi:MAG: DUF1285 domain-containing protein [Alphaproteobacteria bacterium]|nr:DUF1285 domain-containing protein [Alphaproteobacteria bacterium]